MKRLMIVMCMTMLALTFAVPAHATLAQQAGEPTWSSSEYSTAGEEDPDQRLAYENETVYVNSKASLRNGPGLDYDIDSFVSEGTTLVYCDESQLDSRGVEWYNVCSDGEALWISSRCGDLLGE